MNTTHFELLLSNWLVRGLLSLVLLIQISCSASSQPGASNWLDSRPNELARIYVSPFGTTGNLQLPANHGDAAQRLTQATEQQLREEERLQTEYGIHSLTMQGMILSYQDNILEVQGELYDDEEFLTYSRVKRHLEPNEDWEVGLNLVVEQVLDELMRKMSELDEDDYAPYYAVPADHVYIRDMYYSNPYYFGSYYPYYYDAYYVDWGWWRRHRYHDHDHDHDEHHHDQPYNPPSPPKPNPKPHWISDAIKGSLPRSTIVREEKTRRQYENQLHTPPNSSDFGGYWRGDGAVQPRRSFTAPPSSTPERFQPVQPHRHEPANRERATPNYVAPKSYESGRSATPSPRAAPAPAPTPAPRVERQPAPSNPPTTRSGGFSHSAPGSHRRKND